MPQPYLDRRAAACLFDVRRILEYGKVERLTSYISPYVPTAPILVKGRKKTTTEAGGVSRRKWVNLEVLSDISCTYRAVTSRQSFSDLHIKGTNET